MEGVKKKVRMEEEKKKRRKERLHVPGKGLIFDRFVKINN